jgi:hypothetical protein
MMAWRGRTMGSLSHPGAAPRNLVQEARMHAKAKLTGFPSQEKTAAIFSIQMFWTALRWSWIGFVAAGLVMGNAQRNAANEAKHAAQSEMRAWSDSAARKLPALGRYRCENGPGGACAQVTAKNGVVEWWPGANWAQAWLPMEKWRVAHAAALTAGASVRGQELIAQSKKLGPLHGPALTPADVSRGWTPSDRLSLLAPRDPARAAMGGKDEQDAAPRVEMTAAGPAAIFGDGVALPVREEGGRLFVLAQGTGSQAQSMAAALSEQ